MKVHSYWVKLHVLREFELRSGLAVSVQKSSFFASGITEAETDLIKFSTGMPMGTLPVRYLGVPLCTKKLSLLNCEGLLQQIKSRLSSWSAKSLSFAGRLLLIKTVITGITTFWCSTFILSQACVKRINSLCGVFLWQGDIEQHHTARVSWKVVTKPKGKESGSVWVAWFKTEVLNGNMSNLWIMPPDRRYSWQVNKILKLSSKIFSCVKLRVQNGQSCLFWSDNWSPYGSLRSYLLDGSASTLGIPDHATLATLHINNNWMLPPARSERLVNIHALLTTINLNESEDYYEWEVDGKELRCLGVWNKAGIPRHSFLTWLFVLNRCPTRDRIRGWGFQTDTACVLCNQAEESRDHLFFNCQYSWNSIDKSSIDDWYAASSMLARMYILDLEGEKRTDTPARSKT
ncbi:uncharacterized protein LOC125586235 [Brassica napus]|uniref:uncharacterized protein LOC125586235 n=1 Tax=Brassica napus TaxID=3708 RepID=UPI00207AB60B|nr:uncharacterized protein LOC125586235 [Brassica napus]